MVTEEKPTLKTLKDLKHGIEELWSAKQPEVDIVAIPGLGAHPKKCWASNTATGGAFNWLCDEVGLQKEFGDSDNNATKARLLLYHSLSAWIGEFKVDTTLRVLATTLLEALMDKRQNARCRPIVFIGHSMGGLVIAEAINIAHMDRGKFSGIFEAICGGVFFGTPFGGTEIAAFAAMVDTVAKTFDLTAGSSLLKLMKPQNNQLNIIRNDFLRLAREGGANMELYCFHELQKTDLSKWAGKLMWSKLRIPQASYMMVERESAELQGYPLGSLNKDHSNLASFQSIEEEAYGLVREPIRRIINAAPRLAQKRFNATRCVGKSAFDSVWRFLNASQDEVDAKYDQMEKEFSPSSKPSWVLKEKEYTMWANIDEKGPTTQCLWISGPDSATKSAATISIIDDIRGRAKKSQLQYPILFAFYLCETIQDREPDIYDVLKSLLRQLVSKQHILAEHAISASSEPQVSFESLWKALRCMLEDVVLSQVYLVIGDLHKLRKDSESTRQFRTHIYKELEQVDGKGGNKIRWFFTSENDVDINEALMVSNTRKVNLEDGRYSERVEVLLPSYVIQQVKSLSYNEDLSYFASSLIKRRAVNDKIWADIAILLLKQLPTGATDSTVMRRLETIPQGQNELLSSIWKQIFETKTDGFVKMTDGHDDLTEMLRALALSKEILNHDELVILTSLTSEKISKLVAECKPLLAKQGDKIVFVPGQIVKSHLNDKSDSLLKLKSKEEVKWHHGILSRRCFTYLRSALGSSTSKEAQGNITAANNSGKLLEYPVKHWLNHAREATSEFTDILSQEADFWEPDSQIRQKWLSEYERVERCLPKGFLTARESTSLHVAASVGYAKLVSALMKQNEYKDNSARSKQTELKHTPVRDLFGYLDLILTHTDIKLKLHLAAYCGQKDTVRALLDQGVEIDNGKDNHFMTSLAMAAQAGKYEIMKMLIDAGADMNAISHEMGPVINWAIGSGNEDAVELLIEKSAGQVLSLPSRTNSEHKHRSPLSCAVLHSDTNTILDNLLAKHQMKLQPEDYENAFLQACKSGRTSVMEKLMVGLPVGHNFQDDLDIAVESAEWECVRWLLGRESSSPLRKELIAWDKAVVAIAQGTYCETDLIRTIWEYAGNRFSAETKAKVLYWATRQNKIKIVWLLLHDFKINADIISEGNPSALTVAAENGAKDTVDILIQHQATVDCPSGWALQAAAAKGHTNIVETLLGKQAHVNRKIESSLFPQCTALYAACENGGLAMVDLLLLNDADPNLAAGEHGYPVIVASLPGKEEILSLLLGKNSRVNVNVRGKRCEETPLINAAAYLSSTSVNELLEAGANVDDADNNGDTALIKAVEAGNAAAAKLLLNKGADLIHANTKGFNALQSAWHGGDSECIELLIDKTSLRILELVKSQQNQEKTPVIMISPVVASSEPDEDPEEQIICKQGTGSMEVTSESLVEKAGTENRREISLEREGGLPQPAQIHLELAQGFSHSDDLQNHVFRTSHVGSLPAANEKAEDESPVATPTTISDTDVDFDRFLLPASRRSYDNKIYHIVPITTSTAASHAANELSVKKLNNIHDWLWLAGRPGAPRSLSYQQSSSREIIIDERVEMHLVWMPGRMFLKPIPRYLLDHDFWTRCIIGEDTHMSALGFLRSYVSLIQYESDFRIAKEKHLIPGYVTWETWVNFVDQFLKLGNLETRVNKRYHYGELRLSRLNKVCWIQGRIRGYRFPYQTYGEMLSMNMAPIGAATVYIAVVLTAMQVGLATPQLANNAAFQRASYGFTVFSIIAPVGLTVAIIIVILLLFVYNWRATMKIRQPDLEKPQ
ncbi:hypothetical protein MKX08_001153 [Trichoderma sp. CBMAI-0020]|nr:hypothetical protein MKX08_001153 [Trichoderma sp. CBMAI-0020]